MLIYIPPLKNLVFLGNNTLVSKSKTEELVYSVKFAYCPKSEFSCPIIVLLIIVSFPETGIFDLA